jgi:lipopolysaccharide export system permease protein
MKNLIFKKLLYDINIFFFITTISIASIIWIIQAVNFLDIISEDGHGIKVYFLYTIFSLPKIISKILPFIYFITLIQIITQYEKANTLMIYWINGISKMKFSNIIISISFIYFLFQLFMSTLVVPYSLDKGKHNNQRKDK